MFLWRYGLDARHPGAWSFCVAILAAHTKSVAVVTAPLVLGTALLASGAAPRLAVPPANSSETDPLRVALSVVGPTLDAQHATLLNLAPSVGQAQVLGTDVEGAGKVVAAHPAFWRIRKQLLGCELERMGKRLVSHGSTA